LGRGFSDRNSKKIRKELEKKKVRGTGDRAEKKGTRLARKRAHHWWKHLRLI